MNLSRLIAILTLISGLMAPVYAQEMVTATAANTNDVTPNDKIVAESTIHAEPATESSTIPRRAATANLFAHAGNPFGNTTERSNGNGPSPKPQAVDTDKWQFQLTPYLWIAGISGRAGIGNLVVDVDAGITDPNVDLELRLNGNV